MAIINQTMLTLADWAKRMDPDGKVDAIVEILQVNEILEDMIWVEGNLPTGHQYSVRSGYPEGAWRMMNYGVPNTKSQTYQVIDTCGMLEDYVEVDKDEADLGGQTKAFRMSESTAHLIGMSNQMAEAVIYGDQTTHPARITGFHPRFNDLSADNGGQIIDAGGTDVAGNTSIYLVVWAPDKVFGMFPKGLKAGLSHKDLGEVTLEDAVGGQYQGYRDHFQWKTGLCVKDWQYVVRIANIDVSALTKNAATGPDLIDLMTQAVEIPPMLSGGKVAWYCNKTIRSYLRRQTTNKSNVNLTMEQVAGKKALMFDEIPIRRVDAILDTEAQVT